MEERLWKEKTSKDNIDGASITDIESNLNKAVVIVQRLHILLLYIYNTHTYIIHIHHLANIQTYIRIDGVLTTKHYW